MSEPRRKLSISLSGVTWPKGMTAADAADRSELDVSDGGASGEENSRVGAAQNPNLKAWQEAQRTASFKWAGTD